MAGKPCAILRGIRQHHCRLALAAGIRAPRRLQGAHGALVLGRHTMHIPFNLFVFIIIMLMILIGAAGYDDPDDW